MSDWADEKASSVTSEWWDRLETVDMLAAKIKDLDKIYWWQLDKVIAAALRDAAAEGRRNAIEKSAELIGRQVEPRDA